MKISNFTNNSLLFSLIRESDKIKNDLYELLKEGELNFNQALILIILYTENSSTLEPSDFIFALDLSKSTVSQSLTKLEELKMIKRSLHDKDARRNLVKLTNKGIKKAIKAMSIIGDFDKKLESSLSKTELKTILTFLSRV